MHHHPFRHDYRPLLIATVLLAVGILCLVAIAS
jgi:hypothetical protein